MQWQKVNQCYLDFIRLQVKMGGKRKIYPFCNTWKKWRQYMLEIANQSEFISYFSRFKFELFLITLRNGRSQNFTAHW